MVASTFSRPVALLDENQNKSCLGRVSTFSIYSNEGKSLLLVVLSPNLVAECCRRVLVQYKDNDTSVYELRPHYFTVFEIESYLVNEKVHYASQDGKYALSYGSCGLWMIQSDTNR